MKTHTSVSSQRRKSRKAHFTAPSSMRRKMMSSPLSKELKTKYDCKSLPVRKGDTVLIKCGSKEGGASTSRRLLETRRMVPKYQSQSTHQTVKSPNRSLINLENSSSSKRTDPPKLELEP